MNLNTIIMKRILTYAFATLMSMGAMAQTDVTPFIPGSTLDGVNYYLPKTAIRLVIEVEKTTVTPGELGKYAFNCLRLNDVPREVTTTYTLKGINMETYGTPDRKKAYNVKVKSKTLAPLVKLTNDGILLSINREAEPQSELSALPKDIPAEEPIDARRYFTQEMLTAGSTAKLAELCSQEIYDLRDSRNDLIKGEADNTPKDGAQLKLMLDQLDLQMGALESLFKGTTTHSTHYFALNIVPEKEGETIAFRFSKHLGVLDSTDLAGEPIYLNVQPLNSLPPIIENIDITKKKEKMEKGVFYNVPSIEVVSIFTDQQTFAKAEYPMAQFGVVEILSDALFNKNVTTKVTFYQKTGGIEKVEN